MSAATQKPLGDLPRATPVFSYAQAAKGRSPSGPPSVSTDKVLKEEQNIASVSDSAAEIQDTIQATESHSAKRAASEGGQSRNINTTVNGESVPPLLRNTEPNTTPAATTPATQVSEQSQVVVSTPSSPEFGITSASTLLKDDDLFSNANASSDSTWEKLSQGSQNGSKSIEKADIEKEPATNGAWEEETLAPPATPPLKEAPPPTVNIWKQRIDAKAARQPTAVPTTSSSNQRMTTDQANSVTKPFDIGAESRKVDNKKPAKRAHSGNDEKAATAGAKDAIRHLDGKVNGAEASDTGPQKASRPMNPASSVLGPRMPPPPPGDAQSWPTPDSAIDEERKKAQERAEKTEKDKSTTNRSHGKEKWMPVPYVPSVRWDTPIPLPRRGGRAPRAGRDSSSRGGGSSTEKATAGSPEASVGAQATAGERGKTDAATPRTSSGSIKPKRASSLGPTVTRDQRRGSDVAASEKRKDTGNSTLQTEAHRASATTRTETAGNLRSAPGPVEVETRSGAGKGFQDLSSIPLRNEAVSDSHAHPRSSASERRSDSEFKTYEYARDYHNPASARDRGEGRPERGRGGFRARGAGNHTFTHSGIANGHPVTHYAPPSMANKSFSHHERHNSSFQNSSYQPRQTQGRFRSGSQSYSAPHSASNMRFPQGPHANAGHHLPNLHTDVANAWAYQPGSQGIMSANPYNPYMEQVSIVGMVSMQMEYYFSVDNLCKDLYLRRHMDSQGFAFLSVIAKFNRIRQLTQDLELIRYVCLQSPQIEFRVGADGYDRLRKRDGWQQWVLAMEERDPSVQNDGSSPVAEASFPQQPFHEASYGLDNYHFRSPRGEDTNPRQSSDTVITSRIATSPSRPIINGGVNKDMDSQISSLGAVPDVASIPLTLDNSDKTPANAYQPTENTFTDEQVDLLMIVVRKPFNHSLQALPPFHSAASRTFSNGSIDGRTINDEIVKFSECEKLTGINGESPSDVLEARKVPRARSPFPVGSPSRRPNNVVSPPVFWVKDKDTPIDSLPEDLTHEPYNIFRRNALMQRERTSGSTCHYDMDILYQFWSHFLIRNFNARMYQEFRQTALEDVEKNGSSVGLKNLIQYYNESILSQKVVSDSIASDFLSLIRSESNGRERPTFDKLRAAWRNGAFNMKNRKKLDGMIDASLKAELER
ncbi:MAG: hypothetical protein LQ341_003888 [Variospora aurantia]|nr:MAG: hypothetical protein LQ341_003888 [Variospora aurantia]